MIQLWHWMKCLELLSVHNYRFISSHYGFILQTSHACAIQARIKEQEDSSISWSCKYMTQVCDFYELLFYKYFTLFGWQVTPKSLLNDLKKAEAHIHDLKQIQRKKNWIGWCVSHMQVRCSCSFSRTICEYFRSVLILLGHDYNFLGTGFI